MVVYLEDEWGDLSGVADLTEEGKAYVGEICHKTKKATRKGGLSQVGMTGFEPATFPTRVSGRTTGLRHYSPPDFCRSIQVNIRCLFFQDLSKRSKAMASERVSNALKNITSQGFPDDVLVVWPLLCSFNRFTKSSVWPK